MIIPGRTSSYNIPWEFYRRSAGCFLFKPRLIPSLYVRRTSWLGCCATRFSYVSSLSSWIVGISGYFRRSSSHEPLTNCCQWNWLQRLQFTHTVLCCCCQWDYSISLCMGLMIVLFIGDLLSTRSTAFLFVKRYICLIFFHFYTYFRLFFRRALWTWARSPDEV